MIKRIPNCKCNNCNKDIYKRPNIIKKGNVYCSRKCYQIKSSLSVTNCKVCGKIYKPVHTKQKTCSRSCSNVGRTGIKFGQNKNINSSQYRLKLLKDKFDFKSCIEGCNYCRSYDIHRLIQGKDGGKYEIGNMFAICPNQHREIHSNIIEVEKVNDYTLRIVKDNFKD